MARTPRLQPINLPSKLSQIRARLGLTPKLMVETLGCSSPLRDSDVTAFERSQREPPLEVLLCYARLASVPLEALVDDGIVLPERLPGEGPIRAGRCPYCGATERQHKNGRNVTGSQRYICQFCRRNYTPEPLPRGYPEDMRREAVRLYQGGMRPWRIARTLGMSPQTVINWVIAFDTRGSPTLSGAEHQQCSPT